MQLLVGVKGGFVITVHRQNIHSNIGTSLAFHFTEDTELQYIRQSNLVRMPRKRPISLQPTKPRRTYLTPTLHLLTPQTINRVQKHRPEINWHCLHKSMTIGNLPDLLVHSALTPRSLKCPAPESRLYRSRSKYDSWHVLTFVEL